MKLTILLPYEIFMELDGVSRMVIETRRGSYGVLPRRLDCAAALEPGILTYECGSGEAYVAVDEGMMVKSGQDVLVCVRSAVRGDDLGRLQDLVDREFRNRSEQEMSSRRALAEIETGFIRRLADYGHEK